MILHIGKLPSKLRAEFISADQTPNEIRDKINLALLRGVEEISTYSPIVIQTIAYWCATRKNTCEVRNWSETNAFSYERGLIDENGVLTLDVEEDVEGGGNNDKF